MVLSSTNVHSTKPLPKHKRFSLSVDLSHTISKEIEEKDKKRRKIRGGRTSTNIFSSEFPFLTFYFGFRLPTGSGLARRDLVKLFMWSIVVLSEKLNSFVPLIFILIVLFFLFLLFFVVVLPVMLT